MTTRAASPEQASDERRWTGQDAGAQLIRLAVAALPTVVATFAVFALMRLVPHGDSVAARLGWILSVGAAGFVIASATNRFTVRLLPLAALMRLSLVFPDQAPSRFKLAIRAASNKHLKAEVESARHHGLSSDSTEAAGQVLLLTAALGEHDRRTRGHSERVRLFARLLGEEMGIEGDDLERLQWGALVHDVGKLTIPTEILNKPGKLDTTEWAIMCGHAAAGSELVAPLHPFLGPYVAAADGHHEKWDGSGYPLGLSGESIPLAARIVSVADAYEVMTATRAYKKPMTAQAARAELTACAGSHFDPEVVRAFLRLSVGDVNRAAGPAAVFAGIPLIGEVVALFARTATTISAAPAALATMAPAAATAGAMTVAMVASPPPPAGPPDLALNLNPATTWSRPGTTEDLFSTTEDSALESTTTSPLQSTTSSTVVALVPSTTTTAEQTTTTTPTTTALPTTTATEPTTTSATEATTTTSASGQPPADPLSETKGAALTVLGAIEPGADLSLSGPYGDGSFLFRDPAQTLTADLDVNGTTIPAGSIVCIHLFITTEADNPKPWRIDYAHDVLAVTHSQEDLAATDFLSAPGVNYGNQSVRGLGDDDEVKIVRQSSRVRLKLEGDTVDSVRIFIDCSS